MLKIDTSSESYICCQTRHCGGTAYNDNILCRWRKRKGRRNNLKGTLTVQSTILWTSALFMIVECRHKFGASPVRRKMFPWQLGLWHDCCFKMNCNNLLSFYPPKCEKQQPSSVQCHRWKSLEGRGQKRMDWLDCRSHTDNHSLQVEKHLIKPPAGPWGKRATTVESTSGTFLSPRTWIWGWVSPKPDSSGP